MGGVPMGIGRLACALALVGLAFGASGCATIAHEVGWLAWWDEKVDTTTESQRVVVTSEPQGARVSRTTVGSDSVVEVGATPLVDVVPLVVEERAKIAKTDALWIGAGAEMAVGFGLMIAGVTATKDGGTGIDVGRFLGFGMTGSLVLTSGIVDALVALVHGQRTEKPTRATRPADVRYTAANGEAAPVSLDVRVPEKASAHLVLESKRPPPRRVSPDWIVAVMAVEDASKTQAADPDLIASLGDQLRVYVAERGARTIDRSAQESALKDQIVRMKRESYANCYDSSCQIELGKALAATHILRARTSRFGSRCVLNGELVELKTEVTVAAASAQGACEPEGFLQMGEAVARALIGGS